MENYIKNFNNYNKILVYDFKIGYGGIGDCIKYFMFILDICIKFNIRLYYLINNIPLEKCLILKYKQMYIQSNQLTNYEYISNINSFRIDNKKKYIVHPFLFYKGFNFNSITLQFKEVFTFSKDVLLNIKEILPNITLDNYISIHLRLGDKYLETNKEFIICKDDVRSYDINKIYEFIENNKDKQILFFCDNNKLKLELKEKYNNIIITNSNIGHSGQKNTTYKQTLDAITEFFLLSKSNKIYSASYSGFSIVASKFNNVELINI
jgi:hypothetical protein